jgi:uncharacterized protein (DUF1697 family)
VIKTYVVLLRGINVGGKNKLPMAKLKLFLEEEGFSNVTTFMQSGNVTLQSALGAKALGAKIENNLSKKFKLDSSLIKILALDYKTFQNVTADAPKEFGQDYQTYRYFVLFPIGMSTAKAMKEIEARSEIDTAWRGKTAIYYRMPSRTNRNKTKSYLNRIVEKPIYQFITMRSWDTLTKLLEILRK